MIEILVIINFEKVEGVQQNFSCLVFKSLFSMHLEHIFSPDLLKCIFQYQ